MFERIMGTKMVEVRISVRNFVEFLLRGGSIDNRRTTAKEDAMQQGNRIHRMIQRRMGAGYEAEVSMVHRIDCGEYTIVIEGRADGVMSGYDKETELIDRDTKSPSIVIDEIKATYREVKKIKEPMGVHLAQAKCYAFIYALQHEQSYIGVRMTYCNIDTEEIKYFYENYRFEALEEWFQGLIQEYRKWADFSQQWGVKRNQSARELQFPFSYREGQKKLATYVYQTIYHQKKLYIQAPTGVGKTISTLFPAVKALGEEKADKIFYLTAKTITASVATDTVRLMSQEGLSCKTVVLTARDKICFLEEAECNPDACPYAKGHYDRINDAIFDMLVMEDEFTRENIELYAQKYRVCPFEMGLDMSLFADIIVCDYNYLFDPYVYLKRFFADGIKGQYLFLIDEAHNLVERGREMYSASLLKEDFLALKKIVKPYHTKMEKQLEKCNKELLLLKKQCETVLILESCDTFIMALSRLHHTMSKYLEEQNESPIREDVLMFYFEIGRFLEVNEVLDENYVIYAHADEKERFLIREYCVNPSKRLKACMGKGKSSILFSATFLPIQYFKNLLGGDSEDYEVYAETVFDDKKRLLSIANEVTTKYTRRNRREYEKIANYIAHIVECRHGNYLFFFPSYAFLEEVYQVYREMYYEEEKQECILQGEYMSEEAREAFLQTFRADQEKSNLGFCVLGGIFAEGIDLAGERLIGAVIIGTGLPQVCYEREILKEHFDAEGKNGFDYAYRFPGMNKVLQAAGRVIRTTDDVGMIALLDERFLEGTYQRLFPREWNNYEVISLNNSKSVLERFWKGFT